MRWRWEHRGAGIAITLSQSTGHADGVSADAREVGYASGDSQSDAERTESRTLIEPINRGADSFSTTDSSRTDSDAIRGDESVAVTDPRGDHQDPDSHRRPESVDCHPVGDYQPIAERKPVAIRDCGERACRYKRSSLVLVGVGRSIASSRDSDPPARAGTPSTSLEG